MENPEGFASPRTGFDKCISYTRYTVQTIRAHIIEQAAEIRIEDSMELGSLESDIQGHLSMEELGLPPNIVFPIL